MKAWRSCWAAAVLCGLGFSQPADAQTTPCGSARGISPYTRDEGCIPKFTFHVSGECLSQCGQVTREFTSQPVVARGNCNLIGGTCVPDFIEQNVFDIWTAEFYSTSAHKNLLCGDGPEVRASSSPCPCIGCTGGVGPNNNTGTGDDPLVISIEGDELQFTSFDQGVKFDLNADGELDKTAWTAASSDDAFLVLDRNFNGSIDDGLEVFGDETAQLPSPEPNGFRALAVFDDPLSGGNGDGKIDETDPIFDWLMLWTDSNHDGRSQSRELRSVAGVVSAIHLDYQRSSVRDEFGNELRYWSRMDRPSESEGAAVAWNVFFANQGPTSRQ